MATYGYFQTDTTAGDKAHGSLVAALAAKAQAVDYPPVGKRVVRHQGAAYLEWDKTELRHIAEIARWVPVEGVVGGAGFLGARNQGPRGRPWGRQKLRPFSRYRAPYAKLPPRDSGVLAVASGRRTDRAIPQHGCGPTLAKTVRGDPATEGLDARRQARREQGRAERKAQRRSAEM